MPNKNYTPINCLKPAITGEGYDGRGNLQHDHTVRTLGKDSSIAKLSREQFDNVSIGLSSRIERNISKISLGNDMELPMFGSLGKDP